MIYVTHDQVEAMTMADKIVVLRAGNIEQVGSPLELYRAPRNTFVAGFIGSPKMNLIEGAGGRRSMARTTIGIRPEHIDGQRPRAHGRAPSAWPNIWAPTRSSTSTASGLRPDDGARGRRSRMCVTATRST
jgi:ABC-type sugar transport system ATPase subunit